MKAKDTIGIMLVDDHQMLRDGLRLLIETENDMRIVAEAASGEETLDMLSMDLGGVDVVVLDLGLPGMGGLDTIVEMRRRDLACRVVVLTMHNDRAIISRAIKAGVDGFVPKSAAHSHLLQAIRAVYQGQQYLHPQSISAVFPMLGRTESKNLRLQQLSDRECEVLQLIAKGHTSREIGEMLTLSPKTVDTYRLRCMKKLALTSRAELVQFALEIGLLDAV
jgi:two-component system response regulator NreC